MLQCICGWNRRIFVENKKQVSVLYFAYSLLIYDSKNKNNKNGHVFIALGPEIVRYYTFINGCEPTLSLMRNAT